MLIHKLRWIPKATLFFVGFCIPFHSVTVQLGRPMSLSLLSMAIYALSLMPYATDFVKIKKVYGKVLLMPIYYFVFLTVINILNLGPLNTPIFNTRLLLCYVLFYLLLVHIMHDYTAMRVCIWGVALGGILLALLAMMGIGLEMEPGQIRLSIFHMNSNTVGILLSISFIIIVNEFIIADALNLHFIRFAFVFAIFPVISIILLTGSRTALLILAMSVVLSIVFYPSTNKSRKFLILLVGGLVSYYAINAFLSSDNIMVDRFMEFVENKDLSGRDDIWTSYVPYVLKSPIWGYGETGYASISRAVAGVVSEEDGGVIYGFSPHNVIIELLLLSGVIGLAIWLKFWKKIFFMAWNCCKSYLEITPMLLLLPILASILSGQVIAVTYAYVIYAYALSEDLRFKEI